ncbi:Hypothetical protein A7982_02887 [Minicystis rosea]|nr:Hypothetical protein A7982_02887 [Minicystis rosea]
MNGLPSVLAPLPRAITPRRVAVGTVAAITAVLTAPTVFAIDPVRNQLHAGTLAPLSIAVVTTILAMLLARYALGASTSMRARVRVIAGGAGAAGVAAITGYVVTVLLGACTRYSIHEELPMVSLGGFALGAPIGEAFGMMFMPVIVAAREAQREPTHDGLDRVLFAAGASMALVGSIAWLGNMQWALALVLAAGGALLAMIAALRLVARARLLVAVRRGAIPGLTIEPLSGREDEAALLPLVRTEEPPAGVLVAGGAISAYRGERGALRVARVPAKDAPIAHPVAALVADALNELGAAALAVPLAIVGLTVAMFAAALALFTLSAPFR